MGDEDRLQHTDTHVGLALTTLHYEKRGMTKEILSKVTDQLTDREFRELLDCRMPKWMRFVLTH